MTKQIILIMQALEDSYDLEVIGPFESEEKAKAWAEDFNRKGFVDLHDSDEAEDQKPYEPLKWDDIALPNTRGCRASYIVSTMHDTRS